MALISQETVAAVKQATDIVEVVSQRLPMKRAGTNYKVLCPFHEEKTPSFNVHPERQHFKCFGCGKGGDAISFVMDYERVDYPEAIRILAEKAGVPVKYADGSSPEFSREDLFRANEWAAGVFRSLFIKAPEAEAARRFVADRGISDESAELFGIGFSMDSWDHLVGRARRAGMGERLLSAAGLVVERDGRGGHYDRFRGRLMFPIATAQGRTAGFGARTLKDEKPKFVNSPETAVFSKGRGLYGLHLEKEALAETGTAYVVEGYMDVIVPRQAGVRGFVATLGTSLTRDHLKVLQRYAKKVVLVFDADAAGQKASERGLDMLLPQNVDIFVAELPPGMDPDDVVVKEGADELRRRLERPREIFDFLMDSLTKKHGEETPAAKARIVQEMTERIRQVQDPVKEALLVQQLSKRFGIEERTLRTRLEPRAPRPDSAAPPSPAAKAAVELLACAVAAPRAAAWVRMAVAPERYPTDGLRKVAEAAYALFDAEGSMDGRRLLLSIQDPALAGEAATILSVEIPPEKALDAAESALSALLKLPVQAGRAAV